MYRLKHYVRVIQDFMVPEAQQTKTAKFELT